MKLNLVLGLMLLVPVALADVQVSGGDVVAPGQSIGGMVQAAQSGPVVDDAAAAIEPAAGKSAGDTFSGNGLRVLSAHDVTAYKQLFRQARAGQAPSGGVDDKILMGQVKGVYLLNKRSATFSELNEWMASYRDHALAREIYEMADARRERPRQACESKTVTVKGKAKKGKKAASRKVKKSVCHTVGKWGPAPIVPLAVEQREDARVKREEAREADLAKLSEDGRRWLGQSWRLRGKGDLKGAFKVLTGPGARAEIGNVKWQSEMVKLADTYHGQRDWENTLKTATLGADVRGPDRDEALWLAGYAAYRLDNVALAARNWEQLVREESLGGKHYTRAAWWGAKAFSQLHQDDKAKDLLRLGARDSVSFYGQLALAKLGQNSRLDWSAPKVDPDEIAALRKVPAAKRALALAQVDEVAMAQREFRAADPDMPYLATHALAAAAVQLNLPGTALQAAKQLAERGQIVPAALYPLPDQWKPTGGWRFDQALMWGIMRQESAFQPQIGSRVGAQGLMQLMPTTANFVARMNGMGRMDRADLHDPATNLALSQSYLQYLGTKLDGNMMLVVAAYNGGIGNVQRWLDRGVTPGHDPVLWLESIPFDETRDYVEKVFANYWLYQKRLGLKTWSLDALSDGYWPLRWSSNPNGGGHS